MVEDAVDEVHIEVRADGERRPAGEAAATPSGGSFRGSVTWSAGGASSGAIVAFATDPDGGDDPVEATTFRVALS